MLARRARTVRLPAARWRRAAWQNAQSILLHHRGVLLSISIFVGIVAACHLSIYKAGAGSCKGEDGELRIAYIGRCGQCGVRANAILSGLLREHRSQREQVAVRCGQLADGAEGGTWTHLPGCAGGGCGKPVEPRHGLYIGRWRLSG